MSQNVPTQGLGSRGWRAVPRSRRLVVDILWLNRSVPTCAHERVMNLKSVAAARTNCETRISWSMVFVKAFGLVSTKYDVLRQSYHRWPWARIFQNGQSSATIATHRHFQNQDWVLWSYFASPEETPLVDLQSRLERYQTGPVDQVFRRQIWLSSLPAILRRVIWCWNLDWSGSKRAKRLGTFFLTTLAGKGVEIPHPPSFLTANLSYGPLDDDGNCRVTLAYDHRLMDGNTVADMLIELEKCLNGPVAQELAGIRATEMPMVIKEPTAA